MPNTYLHYMFKYLFLWGYFTILYWIQKKKPFTGIPKIHELLLIFNLESKINLLKKKKKSFLFCIENLCNQEHFQ